MHRLVTISVSHYCEKARWALDLAGEPYVEDGHLPMLHWRASFGAGGRRTVPVLVPDDGPVLPDSTDILRWLDARHPHLGLFGDTDANRAEIARWEDHFDRKLGPDARRWAYYHLLPNKAVLLDFASQQVPTWERRMMDACYPLAAAMLRRALTVTDAGLARSLVRIQAALDEVGAALADGRRYLVGDRLSAADLTYATLVAPLVAPPEYPTPLPVDRLPAPMSADIARYRATAAGAYALRLYREERRARRLLPGAG